MRSFGGDTFEADRDGSRLTVQCVRVYDVMKDGVWRTLGELETRLRAPQASISARLRDLRKAKFGGHTVNRRYVIAGLWEYQLIPNEQAPNPAALP